MEYGSNENLINFFEQYGIKKSLDIKEKYNTKAAEVYRQMLAAKVEGNSFTPPKLSADEMRAPANGSGMQLEHFQTFFLILARYFFVFQPFVVIY